MTIFRALAALVVLTLSPVNVSAINVDPYIKFLIRREARKQGADENFCLAVAHIESRKGDREFRTGLIGWPKQYYAPFNIHPDYLHMRGWRIDLLDENIRRGVYRLKGGWRILPSYNASCNAAYLSEIKKAFKKYKEEEDATRSISNISNKKEDGKS